MRCTDRTLEPGITTDLIAMNCQLHPRNSFLFSLGLMWLALFPIQRATAQTLPGSIPEFDLKLSDLVIVQEASSANYFDQTGRKFGLLGNETGEFEAWAWPLKLFIHFDLSFFIGSSTQPLRGRDLATRIEVRPDVTSITYVFQSFTATLHLVVPPNEAGAVMLLDVDTIEPLSVVASFVPTMQPMWPAGLGGQYARWDDAIKAYLISESSRQNHGYLGSPAGQNMSYTPAHMLGENPNQFRIQIDDPNSVRNRLIPILMAGGKGERDTVKATYDRLAQNPQQAYLDAHAHAANLQQQTISITTPEPALNDALEWAKFSYDGLFVENPDLQGTGMMAGLAQAGMGGRPGFGWFFGGDSYLNSLSLNALGAFTQSRDAITFMSPFQRADGKMPHEITQAVDYVDWFGDYPYSYIHADTSPYFIVAIHAYYEATGDTGVVLEQWDALKRAFEWSRKTDLDGDGLMDNEAAGLGALEFGALTGIQTDIYLGAVWIQSLRAMKELAKLNDEPALINEIEDLTVRATNSFEKFWDERVGQYVYAFNKEGETVSEITPWSAVGLMFMDGTDQRAVASLRRMNYSDLTTDWGVRMLSTTSDYYEPLNYNYGAVWPFLTSWVTTAQYKRGLPLQGFSNLMASVGHVWERSLGDVTEVFSGARHTWPQESVPHQGFCTAATVLPTIRGLFGIDYSRSNQALTFAPAVPADWSEYEIRRVALSNAFADINYKKIEGVDTYTISTQEQPVIGIQSEATLSSRLLFNPVFQPGAQIQSLLVNGRSVPFTTKTTPELVQIYADWPLEIGQTRIEVKVDRSLEIISPQWKSQVGDENKGLRILEYTNDGPQAMLRVEGRSGVAYSLALSGLDHIERVEGAHLEGEDLIVQIPNDSKVDFASHVVKFKLFKR